MIQIKKITAKETYQIRLKILRKNIPLPYEFNGDLEENTFHLGAFKNNKLVIVSSFMKASNSNFKGSQYQLRGMAALIEYQGMGLGKLMLEEAFLILRKLKTNCLWCNARIISVKFYEKLGFQTFGEKFEIKDIGTHYVMFKYLGY